MEKFGILLYNSCGVKKENECCREISQQHQVQVLREAEIGRPFPVPMPDHENRQFVFSCTRHRFQEIVTIESEYEGTCQILYFSTDLSSSISIFYQSKKLNQF